MRLWEQCGSPDVSLHRMELPKTDLGWLIDAVAHRRPEAAVMAHMVPQRWTCSASEGEPILLLMKAACLEMLTNFNQFAREHALTRHLEAQVTIHSQHIPKMAKAIDTARLRTILVNLRSILSAGVDEV